MSFVHCLPLIFSFLCWCNGGVIQTRDPRSTERCGKDYHGMGRGDVKLFTEEYNNTGVHMYKSNEDCLWTFDTGEPGTYIMLTTAYFRLEYSEDCIFDYVEISEYGDHEVISRYCGWNDVTYISASNNVNIAFHSDISYEDKGFEIKYETKRTADIDESKCNSVVFGPDPGEISGSDSSCYYSIRAGEGEVIELDLTQLDFGERRCYEERIEVFIGPAGHGKPLKTFCSFNSTGFIGVRDSAFFIAYHKNDTLTSGGFKMAYTFVIDNFPPPTIPPTIPSPVGGDNDCSGRFLDPKNGEMIYTAPTYQDNRHCIIVIRNTLLRNHVIEVTFIKFDLEESDDCEYDSLKILTGEHEGSAMLGGRHGKLYCGDELKDRTLTTSNNAIRLEFKTDESLSFFGFRAKIKFVPNKVCECDSSSTVCIRTGMEKLCKPGSSCSKKCQNGGKCVRNQGEDRCVCRTGFSGELCTEGEGGLELLEFVTAPENRQLVRGINQHYEECKARVVGGQALISYMWTLDGELIGPYTSGRGFGTEPGGMLRFDRFSDQMEGTYSCIASTPSDSRIEHFFEYSVIESCPAGIELGPKNKEEKVGGDVLFECYAPTAISVAWKKNGRIIDFDHETRFTKMSNNYLRIDQLEELDAGTYRCEARSRTGCYGYREAELSVLDVTPLNSFCGRTIYDEEVSTRISMGRVARPAEYPWHVVFRGIKKNQQNEDTFCGGSLISQRWVMTAGHCVAQFKNKFKQDFGSDSVRMYIGAKDCYGTGGIMRQPAEVHLHDEYEDEAYQDSDIALIELSSPVEYTASIKPICLEPATYTEKAFFGRMKMTFGKVAGCGENWRGKGSNSQDLEEISIPFVDRLECEDMFEKHRQNPRLHIPDNFRLTDQMFCAGNDVRRTGDTCKGDSGGALVMVAQNRWVQTGIVSFGIGCDRGNYGIYTNVGKFYDWIKAITKFDEEVVEN